MIAVSCPSSAKEKVRTSNRELFFCCISLHHTNLAAVAPLKCALLLLCSICNVFLFLNTYVCRFARATGNVDPLFLLLFQP